MAEPSLSPDLLGTVADLERRVNELERSIHYVPQVVPFVHLGAYQTFGFSSKDTTTFSDLFRADVLLSAPFLDYDIQLGDFGTGVISIEWQIIAHFPIGITHTVASGQGTQSVQFTDKVDIISLLGIAALQRVVRFDVEAKRTGGSGEIGVRFVRPMVIRIDGS